MKETLTALACQGEQGRALAAPTVGRYLRPPPVGTHLAPGAEAGLLRILRRTFRLVVPAGGAGVVREVLVATRGASVERGQPLLALADSGEVVVGDAPAGGPAASAADEEVPEGMLAVRAPTDGIFYRRPDPESQDFVDEGDVVERGKVLGLVEVMKCFNQIAYGGEGDLPARARVARVLPDDAAEVKLGQALFLVEPA